MTFSHNHEDDTILERDGSMIEFTFWSDTFTYEDPDRVTFDFSQDELFWMLGEYFDDGAHAEIFDELTLPAQDALWNALLYLNQNGIEL